MCAGDVVLVVATESAIELAVKKVAAKEVEVVVKAVEEEVLVAEVEVIEVIEVLAEEVVVAEVEVFVDVEKVERVEQSLLSQSKGSELARALVSPYRPTELIMHAWSERFWSPWLVDHWWDT